ncbi:uncharacterized protein LOC118774524 [Megalops cyprinoides]|uniref:uncharacterized protein LOC118774524 n=1 Tax=Megalops cyprinoides TaxID=118141 RepID=UPI001864C626|nr:uncharacterized protein LOC118774524 [Megalops cyprinoides]
MSAFVGVLLVLATASQGTATKCEVNHTVQCYGALGESVFLRLPQNTSIKEMTLKKGNFRVLKLKNGNITDSIYINRSKLFTNSTFRLDRVVKNDSGEYNLELYASNGNCLPSFNINLTVQATVSKPTLSQFCLPHGEVRVSCSMDGDASEYSWTLEHKPLDGSLAYLSHEKDTVILKRNVTGALTCTARNRVCDSATTVQLSACPAPVTCRLRNGTEVLVNANSTDDAKSLLRKKEICITIDGREILSVVCDHNSLIPVETQQICVNITLLLAVLGAVFATLVLSVAIYCWSKQNNKSATTDNSDDHELVYAEVMCHKKVKRERTSEVVYGQVKVTQSPHRTEGRTEGQEEELYAKVRK